MTAGRGIVHSERSLPTSTCLHAAQLWIALPATASACEPAFEHHAKLPVWNERGCRLMLLAGRWGERRAPARLYSELVGLAQQRTTLSLPLQPGHEYGLMTLQGRCSVGAEVFDADELAYLGRGSDRLELTLEAGARAAARQRAFRRCGGTSSAPAARRRSRSSATGRPATTVSRPCRAKTPGRWLRRPCRGRREPGGAATPASLESRMT